MALQRSAVLVAAALVVAGCSSAEDATDEVVAEFGPGTPGCAVAVRSADGEIHTAEHGDADIDRGVAIDEGTIFDVGSVSKQITAGVVALLVLDGTLDADDDITDLIDADWSPETTITIEDLVHHTSGLPDYIELLDAADEDVTTMDDTLEVIGSPDGAPTAAAGTEFAYSNTNYVLLAAIVEQATSMSMSDVVAERVFEPLGMQDSVVRDDQGTLLDAQAVGYEELDDGWAPVSSAWRQTGDGAVHSTASDLLVWAELFLDDPRDAGLGSAEWLELMLAPGDVADGDEDYGGGLQLRGTGDDRVLAHGGSWIGYGSAIAIRPSDGVAVAVTCNIDGVDAEALAEQTMDIWLPS